MLGVYFADRGGSVVPALGDVRVRQALNYAIDREAIASSIYGEFGTPTSLYVPEGMEGYQEELQDTYPYDPEKAKELLAEAGYPDGFSFTLLVQPGVDAGDLLAAAISEQWAAIGVDVELKAPPTFADFNTDFYSNQYGANTLTFDYAAQNIATNALASAAGGYNTFKFIDAEADDLLAQERLFDTKSPEGVAAAEAAESHLVETAIGAPVVSSDTVIYASKSVTGIDFSIFLPQPQYWKPAR
jgi:peptide/nickel transport system substrate-binding protein